VVLDGRTDHNHEIEDDRKAQRSNLRQARKRNAVDDIKLVFLNALSSLYL
jgi:hypothetical protein